MRTESRRKIAPARTAAGKPQDAIEMRADILAFGCIRPAGHVTAVIDLIMVWDASQYNSVTSCARVQDASGSGRLLRNRRPP